MLTTRDTARRAINLPLNAKVPNVARGLGLNISQTVDELLAVKVERLYWQHWSVDNQAAIAHYNERVAKEGLPLARYRNFMKGS